MVAMVDYAVLSAVLFTIGVVGILIRRNIITILMCIELILNSVNLLFVAFSRFIGNVDGQVFVFFIFAIAAAEAAVGLALVVAYFKLRETIEVDEIKLLKG
ncbi:NADH-quinone oxidoreductase subunit K [Thermotomaculum hydrothermale]|uniref:NADH-quinone oxidoreductase subunit K n=1 Tax=Thermotomaculum hydrothermale TaxID=981385 RepID=A0A7R6PZP9_9BACT|nr:NADH-quinone oxidoreductase subunit NuoK [Thermotomaculum hydrothermale]BBB32773.1 NADH-quinone oxidoreductase subunit K [Thermotomaculum hydrothermale]